MDLTITLLLPPLLLENAEAQTTKIVHEIMHRPWPWGLWTPRCKHPAGTSRKTTPLYRRPSRLAQDPPCKQPNQRCILRFHTQAHEYICCVTMFAKSIGISYDWATTSDYRRSRDASHLPDAWQNGVPLALVLVAKFLAIPLLLLPRPHTHLPNSNDDEEHRGEAAVD